MHGDLILSRHSRQWCGRPDRSHVETTGLPATESVDSTRACGMETARIRYLIAPDNCGRTLHPPDNNPSSAVTHPDRRDSGRTFSTVPSVHPVGPCLTQCRVCAPVHDLLYEIIVSALTSCLSAKHRHGVRYGQWCAFSGGQLDNLLLIQSTRATQLKNTRLHVREPVVAFLTVKA